MHLFNFHRPRPAPVLTPLHHLSPFSFSTPLYYLLLSLLYSHNLKLCFPLPCLNTPFWIPIFSPRNCYILKQHPLPHKLSLPHSCPVLPAPKLVHLFKCTPANYNLVLDLSTLLPSLCIPFPTRVQITYISSFCWPSPTQYSLVIHLFTTHIHSKKQEECRDAHFNPSAQEADTGRFWIRGLL